MERKIVEVAFLFRNGGKCLQTTCGSSSGVVVLTDRIHTLISVCVCLVMPCIPNSSHADISMCKGTLKFYKVIMLVYKALTWDSAVNNVKALQLFML